jgi:hypothetical protein
VVSLAALALAGTLFGLPAQSPPPLPLTGRLVRVATEAQLQDAIRTLASNTTIVLAAGTYHLTRTLWIGGALANVAIRGASDDRDAVVLAGNGMTRASDSTPFGIWTGGGVDGVTIANLTIRDVPSHAIIFNAGTQKPHVFNVHLIDTGQQFIKSNPDDRGGGVNGGIVEYSVMEYTTKAKDDYTNGVDVHTGAGWIVRHNLFRNIVSTNGLAGPAVLFWNHSTGTLTEGNQFVNCARGISYGLQDVRGFDHAGGTIRNNYFFRAADQPGDAAILVADSPGTQVVNNTVFVSGTYRTPIEYRFAETTGTLIANNITDGSIAARNGAVATTSTNIEGADPRLFVDALAGDLHLAATAAAAIDRGTTLADVADDWDGDPRPIGGGFDIGADERRPSTGGDPSSKDDQIVLRQVF